MSTAESRPVRTKRSHGFEIEIANGGNGGRNAGSVKDLDKCFTTPHSAPVTVVAGLGIR